MQAGSGRLTWGFFPHLPHVYSLESSFSGWVNLNIRAKSTHVDGQHRANAPLQASSERVFSSFQLKRDIQHRINSGRDVMTSFALDIALQLSGKCRMDDTITGNVRMPLGG